MVAQSLNFDESSFSIPEYIPAPIPEKDGPCTGTLRKDIIISSAGTPDDKGNSYWIFFDPVADKYYKLSGREYRIISYIDKNYTYQNFIKKINKLNISITETEIKQIITFLENKNLLNPVYTNTEKRLSEVKEQLKKAKSAMILSSYAFIRIPLCNPDSFLSRTSGIVAAVFNKWMMLFLFIISLSGYISFITNWSLFSTAVKDSLNIEGIAKYSIAIIFLKIIHESAHAYTAKIEGARVRRLGLNFIYFLPRVYTDLTDAWRLKDNFKRAKIDAAGIISELLIGGFAALVWLNTGPGMFKNTAYYVFSVSIINTVLVNGNPFIKYDGYFILTDILNIDNLQKKASSALTDISRMYLFGIDAKPEYSYQGFKKYFLFSYSILSFFYKFLLYFGIIMTVYLKFTKALGIVMVCLQIYSMIIKPVKKEIQTVISMKERIKKKNLYTTLSGTIIIILIIFIPLPWTISLPFEVKVEQEKVIYAPYDGFIDRFNVKNYSKINANDTIMVLTNPFLGFELAERLNEYTIIKKELDQISHDAKLIEIRNQKQVQVRDVSDDIKEHLRKEKLLTLKAPFQGTFIIFNDKEYRPEKWVAKGEKIGGVFNLSEKLVFAYADERDVEKINIDDSVTMYLNNDVSKFKGRIININRFPAKSSEVSPVLSSFGGSVQVNGKMENNQYAYKLNKPQYILTIKPDDNSLPFGRSGYVHIRKYSSLGFDAVRKAIAIIQKELSF
jgi:putative peptide zinc metalloprotease protein